METVEHSLALPASVPSTGSKWRLLLLDHLDEFATLAWYLLGDSDRVETALLGSLKQLDALVLDKPIPVDMYAMARNSVIAQAIVMTEKRKAEEADEDHQASSFYELPDLSRLASLLLLDDPWPEFETASWSDTTSRETTGFDRTEIERIGTYRNRLIPDIAALVSQTAQATCLSRAVLQ